MTQAIQVLVVVWKNRQLKPSIFQVTPGNGALQHIENAAKALGFSSVRVTKRESDSATKFYGTKDDTAELLAIAYVDMVKP